MQLLIIEVGNVVEVKTVFSNLNVNVKYLFRKYVMNLYYRYRFYIDSIGIDI